MSGLEVTVALLLDGHCNVALYKLQSGYHCSNVSKKRTSILFSSKQIRHSTHRTVFIHYENCALLHLHEGDYGGSYLLQNDFQALLLFKY